MTTSAAPGWYPDPHGAPVNRWYDGQQWTATTSSPAPTPVATGRQVSIHYGFALLAVFSLLGTVIPCIGLFSSSGADEGGGVAGGMGIMWLLWGGMWTLVWTAFAISHTLKSRS
ncbi:DUF2510 domain-containing protein [Mycobacterium sp. 360MFTsu5.1]|uniref:DUF2510 domain-containing protein n=1 Tax=Mycobacterium sp. 360MFTsu5.1 TaxID=1172186 RepID=UPI00048E377C|nr:DUF2510 domain-containing protein [Mycobacterium sp. 360MFTsu5.1]